MTQLGSTQQGRKAPTPVLRAREAGAAAATAACCAPPAASLSPTPGREPPLSHSLLSSQQGRRHRSPGRSAPEAAVPTRPAEGPDEGPGASAEPARAALGLVLPDSGLSASSAFCSRSRRCLDLARPVAFAPACATLVCSNFLTPLSKGSLCRTRRLQQEAKPRPQPCPAGSRTVGQVDARWPRELGLPLILAGSETPLVALLECSVAWTVGPLKSCVFAISLCGSSIALRAYVRVNLAPILSCPVLHFSCVTLGTSRALCIRPFVREVGRASS